MQDWLQQNSAATPSNSHEKLQELLDQRIEKKEILLQDHAGKVREFDVKVAPFSNGNRLFGYTFLLTDLSETRKREKELIELNANKDRLFTIIAHDLRKPVLSFRGIGKKINYLIIKDDQERLKSFGQTIGKAAFSLNSLLDNLLNWAAQQQNLLPSNPGVQDLLAITDEIHREMAIMAAEKEIDLQFSIPAHTMVYVDPNGLLTIIRNLINNAIKFTARGGAVRFSASTLEDRVTLTVSDDGIGIASEELPNLFELSETISHRGTEGEKGTGLGLHLVRELVKINQGTISVESTQAQGSVFSVVFPKQAQKATS
jgi:signal transduction histidine kinase